MTKLIGFGRCLDKTTMAILESHATGNRILVPNQRMAENTFSEEITELKKELVACYREKEEDQATIEDLKDKCVDLMLENADYVWDEMARSAIDRKKAEKRRPHRRWRGWR